MKSWDQIFVRPVSIAPLVTFRIVFGLLMMFSTARFMGLGWIEDHFVEPVFHFSYFGFDWIKPLSREGLYAVHILLFISALFVALGFLYRLAALLVFLCFTYTELIDLTYYLNHYYFVSLVSFLLILVPANRSFSLDVWRDPRLLRSKVPAWCVHIFMLQIGLVYFYAGVFKINTDWLIEALPLKIWLPAQDQVPMLGPLFKWEFTPYLFAWAGMLYDLTIVFWLLNRKTRPFAYLAVVVFHTLTGILFQIGVFPLVMTGLTLIFFSAEWHQQLHHFLFNNFFIGRKLQMSKYIPDESIYPNSLGRHLNLFLGLYLVFQILFPWRFLLYPGNMFWTEQGYRFGWRVMLMEKAGTATFYVKDSQTGREGEVYNCDFLTPHQEKQMAMQPDMILQYAHFLGSHFEKQGIQDPEVRAEVYVTLNGRPSRLLIDSTLNLMTVRDSWGHKDWILPRTPR